jgi:SAM-dependent methyltransferase
VTLYDDLPYAGRSYPYTHPDNLAAMAALLGMTPAPIERCRMLEIGCGDGANLIPIAYGLPEARFVGFDLAVRPIERGALTIERLGLDNVALVQADIAAYSAAAGTFDYIVAHGVYSWIPTPVRDRLLALIGALLAPNGVAFVSYNAYPGCYLRRMAWEMLRFHTDHLEEPQERLAEARALARLIAGGRRSDDDSGALLRKEMESLAEREPSHLFHDDLATINDPVYFHQFVDHAAQHGLQFLAEAELHATGYGGLANSVRPVLDRLDPLTREQYLDFIKSRRFRQSLLCRAGIALDREGAIHRAPALLVTARGPAKVIDDPPAGAADTRAREQALVQTLLDVLSDEAPRALSFGELAALASARPGGEPIVERGVEFFGKLVLDAARAGALALRLRAPRLVPVPGEMPKASAIARIQIESSDLLTTLCHDCVKLDDDVARRLLGLLDGTRDRAALLAALGKALRDDEGSAPAALLERHLANLAKLALLEA